MVMLNRQIMVMLYRQIMSIKQKLMKNHLNGSKKDVTITISKSKIDDKVTVAVQGMNKLHSEGIIHADLKTSNVLIK